MQPLTTGDIYKNYLTAFSQPYFQNLNFITMALRKSLQRLQEIETDERLFYPAANIGINAPLALIQVSLKSEAQGIRFALREAGIEPPRIVFHDR